MFLLVEAFKSFLDLDKIIGDTAKQLGVSYNEAAGLSQQFNNIANKSGSIFVTTKGINESFLQINAALGTNANLSEELLLTQTQLTKQAFYSVEAATQISKLSLATGKPAKEITTEFLGQAKALNLINNTAINEKTLIESISKTSKGLLATFAAQPKKLIESAYAAKKIGLELESIQGIQDSLLNIESSIAAEFEAEVITGKQLNLERARYYALTNNIAGLAQELTKQNVTQATFSKMNILQQESVAKAMGLSRDQLGGMLIEQEALSKLTGGDTEENRKKLALLKEQGFSTQAIAELGQDELDRQMKSASIQDRFNASIEKLKEIFVTIAEPLMPILDVFASILSIVGLIMKPIGWLFEKMSALGPVLGGIVKFLSAAAIAAFMLTTSLTGGLAAAGILAAIGGGMALYQNYLEPAGDINSPANGKTQVSTKEGGLFELSKNDDLIAAPGAAQMMRQPKTVVVNSSQSPMIDYEKLGAHIAKAVTANPIQAVANIDGVSITREIQTPMGITTRKI
jgi:hypothetical protein